MTYTMAELLEMKLEDLVELGNTQFNLSVSKKFNKSQIASLVMAEQIVSNEGKEFEGVTALSEKQSVQEDLPKGYCVLRLQKSFRNPNGTPVPIGLNGKISIAPVGKNFKCPEYFIEILSHAMEEQLSGMGEDGRAKTAWAHAYPFTVIKHNPSDKWPQIDRAIEKFENGLRSSLHTDVEYVA